MKYRPEIDGLRTVAVGSVLLYHAQFPFGDGKVLPGGFLGVDVFFVISGFLITSLIYQEFARTQRFSVLKFYERRARRLLPALFAVIFASLPAAWFILLPTQMMEFANSLLASVFFVSNMFWYATSLEYGATTGLIKPFLHTWSLAVEEQFYIVFPLLYLLILRKTPGLGLIWLGLGIFFGLAFSEYYTRVDADLSFYWVLSRLWELFAGAFLAHLIAKHPTIGQKGATWRILPGIGLVMLTVPLFIPGLLAEHPGFVTMPTVIGTSLIILFADPREIVTRLLSSKPFVAIGLISYSLYLWHYPIFAFGRLLDPTPEILDRFVWLFLAGVFATLSYWVVERPFRNAEQIPVRPLITIGTISTALVMVFSAGMLMLQGYPDRLAPLYAIYAPAEPDNARIDDVHGSTWQPTRDLALARGVPEPHVRLPGPIDRTELWFETGTADEKILILGNSLSMDLLSAFQQNQPLFENRQFARFAMRADFPNRQIDHLLQSENFQAADTILIGHAYTKRSVQRLDAFLDRLIPTGKTVVLLLNSPIFERVDGYWPFDWYVRQNQGLPDPQALNRLGFAALNRAKTDPLDTALAEVATRRGIPVLARRDFICDDAAQTCDMVTPDGYKMFTDQHHYTRKGAALFGKRIAETGWLDQATRSPAD